MIHVFKTHKCVRRIYYTHCGNNIKSPFICNSSKVAAPAVHHARMLLLVTLMVVLHLEVREARDEPIIPSFGTPEDGLSCVSCGFGTRRQ